MELRQDILVGSEALAETLKKGEIEPLDDIHDIEAVVYAIQDLTTEVTVLQGLKRKRAEAIDVAIEKVKKRVDFLKAIIHETLTQAKEKKVNFPGVGAASIRRPRVSFKIIDEKQLVKYLTKEGEYDNVVSVEEVQEIKKHELNKLLLLWDKIDKLPACVEKAEPERSVTVKFAKGEEWVEQDNASVQDLDFS